MPTKRPAQGNKQSVDMLMVDPDNARTISDANLEGLGKSLAKLGDLSGIVWNERSGLLVCGHQRMDRLLAAGAKEWTRIDKVSGVIQHPQTGEPFPIRIVDWDEATSRMAGIAANNPELQGEFADNLQDQLQALQTEADFEELRLQKLLEEEESNEPRERRTLEDFDTMPAPKKAWILIATTDDLAPEIEADLRERYEAKGEVQIEVSIGVR